MIDRHQPTGFHFSQAAIDEACATMRARLDEKAAAGDIGHADRRAAEVFVLGYIGFAPAEVSRGTSLQELGDAVIGSLGWIVAQLCIGAPSAAERMDCVAEIATAIGQKALDHIATGRIVAALKAEAGAHA